MCEVGDGMFLVVGDGGRDCFIGASVVEGLPEKDVGNPVELSKVVGSIG